MTGYGSSLTVVPRDLYYVERALVERQAAEIVRLKAALTLLIEKITDLEGREGMTDYDFAEQVIALAHSQRAALTSA